MIGVPKAGPFGLHKIWTWIFINEKQKVKAKDYFFINKVKFAIFVFYDLQLSQESFGILYFAEKPLNSMKMISLTKF